MKTTLEKSMVEFVLNTTLSHNDNRQANEHFKCVKYAKFLSTKLELGQFIPCKDGVPLEEPQYYWKWYNGSIHDGYSDYAVMEFKQYKQAKENCIFKHDYFKVGGKLIRIQTTEEDYILYNREKKKFYNNGEEVETIESLIPYKFELTEYGKQLAGL